MGSPQPLVCPSSLTSGAPDPAWVKLKAGGSPYPGMCRRGLGTFLSPDAALDRFPLASDCSA